MSLYIPMGVAHRYGILPLQGVVGFKKPPNPLGNAQ
jgi:hypothetical protein